MKKPFIAIMFLLLACPLSRAQMTRGQLLKKFYQVTTLHESGNDSQAIAVCEEIVAMYPKLPDPYLRMAQIYDEAGELENALVMYRQYVNLEMDDSKVAQCSARLKELESEFGVQSMESREEEMLQQLGKMTPTSGSEAVQAVSGGSISSLFDLSALVQTAVEDVPVDSESESAGLILPLPESDDLEFIREAEFDIDTRNIVEEISKKAAQMSASYDCGTPFLFLPHPERLENSRLAGGGSFSSKPVMKTTFDSPESVTGRWISSKSDSKTGLEYVIFDFKMIGARLNVTFNRNSGIFVEKKNGLLSESWNTVKSIWAPDGASFNPDILKDDTRSCQISESVLSFDFALEKKNRPDWIMLGKSVIDGVLSAIPFGSVAGKLGGSIVSSASRNATSYQTFLNFSFRSVTDNVMLCTLTVMQKQTGGPVDKEVLVEEDKFYMYRVSQDYEGFRYSDETDGEAIYEGIYSKLLKESQTSPELLFPLAYMSFYGVGMNRGSSDSYRMSKALEQMQTLADKKHCNRARAWLVPVSYNLSLDEKHYPLRAQRKRFREFAVKQLGQMLVDGNAYANALQGDILVSEGNDLDKAFEYYRRGAEMSDPYSLFCLGKAYSEGVLVQRDYEKALDCFRKSAQAGYADAWLKIALASKNGYGLPVSYDEYIKCLHKAIGAGSTEALSELSLAYFWGIGVERDIDSALAAKRAWLVAGNNVWRDVLELYGYSPIQL